MKPPKLKDVVIVIGLLCLFGITGSIGHYYIYTLPKHQSDELQYQREQDAAKQAAADEKQRAEEEKKAAQDSANVDAQTQKQVALQNCLDTADTIYTSTWTKNCLDQGLKTGCSLSLYIADRLTQQHELGKTDCFKQYPQQ